jgi:hypothetical protein
MAPEQVQGLRNSPAMDIFAWGLLVAYAATGRSPLRYRSHGSGCPWHVVLSIQRQADGGWLVTGTQQQPLLGSS